MDYRNLEALKVLSIVYGTPRKNSLPKHIKHWSLEVLKLNLTRYCLERGLHYALLRGFSLGTCIDPTTNTSISPQVTLPPQFPFPVSIGHESEWHPAARARAFQCDTGTADRYTNAAESKGPLGFMNLVLYERAEVLTGVTEGMNTAYGADLAFRAT